MFRGEEAVDPDPRDDGRPDRPRRRGCTRSRGTSSAAHGQHPTVEVLPLHLDHGEVAAQHLGVGAADLIEPREIDRELLDWSLGPAVGEVDDLGAVEIGPLVGRQQLIDGHVVEAGEPLQSRHGDRTLTPLVGAKHRSLELLGRVRLDVLQRKSLLAANASEAFAHPASICSGLRLIVRQSIFCHARPCLAPGLAQHPVPRPAATIGEPATFCNHSRPSPHPT